MNRITYCFSILVLFALTSCSNTEEQTKEVSNMEGIMKDANKTASSHKNFDKAYKINEPPRTIKDYFFLLPDKHLKGLGSEASKQLALAQDNQSELIWNDQDQFLYIKNPKWENTLSLYELKDGEKILAVGSGVCLDACCEWDTQFLQYKDKEWVNLTDKYLPEITFKNFCQKPEQLELLTDLAMEQAIRIEIRHQLTESKSPIISQIDICFEEGVEEVDLSEITNNQLFINWENNEFVLDENSIWSMDELYTYVGE